MIDQYALAESFGLAGPVVDHSNDPVTESDDKDEKRNWEEWDAEHPYVSHPRDSEGNYVSPDNAHTDSIHPDLQERADKLSVAMDSTISLFNVDRNAQEGVITSLEKFHEQYPAIQVSVITSFHFGDDSHVMAETTPTGIKGDGPYAVTNSSVVKLNQLFFSSDSKIENNVAGAQLQGFLTTGVYNRIDAGAIGTDNVTVDFWNRTHEEVNQFHSLAAEQLMDHELGHVLFNSIGAGDGKATIREGLAVAATAHNPTYLPSEAIKDDISEYATNNGHEMVAEAFAQSRGSHPSAEAEKIVGDLDYFYKQRYTKS